jgi:hypothetical protein
LRTQSWPFRQDDPEWSADVMWDRGKVMEVHRRYNGKSAAQAKSLLRAFRAGNTIGNEGCLITCLAMVLRLLAAKGNGWTPKKLNHFAQDRLYYTPAGLSMATLYADLVCEASNGEIQLLLKEEYLSGETAWPRTTASICVPLRAYRGMSPRSREDLILMLKTGTYDDTVASHFVVVDPLDPGPVDADDVAVLDPAQPLGSSKRPWFLSDSSRRICEDAKIRAKWRRTGILDLQLAGVWVFARWVSSKEAVLGGSFLKAVASLAPDG